MINLDVRPPLPNFLAEVGIPFQDQISFRGGVEVELYLPYNRNMFSILLEASNFNYESDFSESVTIGSFTTNIDASLDLNMIVLSPGLRGYYSLSEDHKLFANLSYAIHLANNSTLTIENQDYKLIQGDNLQLGLGYRLKNRFMAEFRYSLGKPFAYENDIGFETDFSSFTFTLGVNVF